MRARELPPADPPDRIAAATVAATRARGGADSPTTIRAPDDADSPTTIRAPGGADSAATIGAHDARDPAATRVRDGTAGSTAATRPGNGAGRFRFDTKARPVRPPAPATGPLVLDRYRLRRRLGTGAFATVWQASDERLRREVAVKLLPRERIAGGRFEREARAAARLAHPGIVTLYEAAVDDEGAYLVSELVRGSTLARLLEDGRLSDRAIVRIGIALCNALAHAHAEGVVHRDVKPSNILIPRRPTTPDAIAKLTDFGVARVIGGNPLTHTGDVIGTAAYMAPEQAEGRPADAPADLYSLAVVLYEALTGVNPLAKAPRTRRLGIYLPPLRRQRRDLPRALGQAIDQALRPRPRERGTIEELRDALERSINVVGDRPGVVEPATRWRPRRRDEDAEPATRWRSGRREEDAEPGTRWRIARSDADREPTTRWRPDSRDDDLEPTTRWRPPSRHHDDAPDPADDDQPDDPEAPPYPEAPAPAGLRHTLRRHPPPWAARALAGATAAGLAAWLTTHLIPHPPLTPTAAALIAALLVTALPQIGWLALTATATALLATQHLPGAALVILIAMLASPLPAIAPALGAVGLAGAWPALAAKAGTTWERAALGAGGWLWLNLMPALVHKSLYTRLTVPPPSHWTHSFTAAATYVLSPLLSAGALATLVIWAAGAAILPLARRQTSFAAAAAATTVWSIVLTLATTLTAPSILPGMAALGAVAGIVFTLAPDVTNRLRRPTLSGDLRSMESR
jgi:serine/threonine protein kinase